MVAYVAETVSQVVSAECISKCESSIDFNESNGRIEYQAASICQQRRALSHADLQALLKPTTEAIVAEVTPKVATVSLCEGHHCNAVIQLVLKHRNFSSRIARLNVVGPQR